MAEIKEFIVNDRRKFTADGDLRPDAPPSEPKPIRPETLLEPTKDAQYGSSARLVDTPAARPPSATESPVDSPVQPSVEPSAEPSAAADPNQPPPLTAEQSASAARAYDATVARLDTALRAANPGAEPLSPMTFERVIQSLYMQALIQLGAAADPGQQPQLDLLGARQTIDMLATIASKSTPSLSPPESLLLDNALFELRMGFLEVTQALAQQAAQRQSAARPQPAGGPKIVR